VQVSGVVLTRGSRVVLRPQPGGDVLDLVLAGRVAVVEGIEQDAEGELKLAVVVEDDPGRDLGEARQPGHRFFFSTAEVEPLAEQPAAARAQTRVLVAGVGNVFLGDDGFGVELAGRLAERALPAGVEVIDYGIRGIDLAYALLEDYDAAVLLDATPRGGTPGSLYLIEPDLEGAEVAIDAHGMDPVKVLALARTMGELPRRVLVVGCEPLTRMQPDDPELRAELSAPVRAALQEGVRMTEAVLDELTQNAERSGR
jgi:hydrogenase maturation protease